MWKIIFAAVDLLLFGTFLLNLVVLIWMPERIHDELRQEGSNG
jgi:hypothetical protein